MTFWGFDTFAIFLLFARVGAMVMLLPGFGESSIPPRVRLAFALALSVALAPRCRAVICQKRLPNLARPSACSLRSF